VPHPWLIRKTYQTYWRFTRPLTLGAQGLIFKDDGKVLLVRHGYRPGWHFPGGGVEKNETLRTAVIREVKEETGIKALSTPRLIGIYANFKLFPSDHVVLFVIDKWERAFMPKPNAEIAEHGFFSPDALPSGTVPAVHRRLAELQHDRPIDENW